MKAYGCHTPKRPGENTVHVHIYMYVYASKIKFYLFSIYEQRNQNFSNLSRPVIPFKVGSNEQSDAEDGACDWLDRCC